MSYERHLPYFYQFQCHYPLITYLPQYEVVLNNLLSTYLLIFAYKVITNKGYFILLTQFLLSQKRNIAGLYTSMFPFCSSSSESSSPDESDALESEKNEKNRIRVDFIISYILECHKQPKKTQSKSCTFTILLILNIEYHIPNISRTFSSNRGPRQIQHENFSIESKIKIVLHVNQKNHK